MTCRIGIISVRGPAYHPTRRLMAAAAQQGHIVDVLNPYRLWPAFLNSSAFFCREDENPLPDAVLPRQGADVGPSCLALVRQFSQTGIPVINDFDAIRISRHQFYTLQALAAADIPFPDSVFINAFSGLPRAVDELGGYPVVIKQVSNRQGSGVFRIDSAETARTMLAGHLGRPAGKRPGLLVQRYLPPEDRQDIRVLVIGNRVAGAQALTPAPGDFRANFHLSGRSRLFDAPASIQELSIRAARAVGLDIAGVDLMMQKGCDPLVVEVNYAPGFKGLEAATGRNIAGEIIDCVVERITAGKQEKYPCG